MNFRKCWIFGNLYVKSDLQVKDNCHVTRKYRSSAHKDSHIKDTLNHVVVVYHCFRQLKKYDSHIIVQKLGKFNL